MKSAYSLDGITWVDLPAGPQFDAVLGVDENNIDLETDGGARWVYRLFVRDHYELVFKITLAQIAQFRALHDAVDGETTPFYYTLDRNAIPIVSIYGRKEQGFITQGTGEKVSPPVFTYKMIIKGEILPLAVFGIEERWHVASPGFDSVYSTPIQIDHFIMGGVDQGAVAIWQSWDFGIYAKKIGDTTSDDYLWRYSTAGPCYGRPQAVILQGETDHTIFGASHDGYVYALYADGTLRWNTPNLYAREGGYTGGTPMTPVANTGGASFVQVSGKAWHPDSFIRSHTVSGANAKVRITTGLGSGSTLYEIKEVAPADHSKLTFFSGVFPAVDATSRIIVVPYTAWALFAENSDTFWQHAGTLALEGGVDYLIACGFDGTATKITAATGAVTAYVSTLEQCEAWPLVVDVGLGHLSVVFGSIDKKVRCLKLSDFSLEWSHTFPQGIDAVLTFAPVDAATPMVIVNGRRSGDATAGRTTYLKAIDGTLLFQSIDMGGDMDTQPCAVLQPDGTYYVFVVGDAGKPTLLDQGAVALWQKTRGDLFNSSPVGYDLDNDGFAELIIADMDGDILIYNQNGVLLGTLTAYAGVEGIPLMGNFLNNGKVQFLVPTIATGPLKGRMTCYEFSQGF